MLGQRAVSPPQQGLPLGGGQGGVEAAHQESSANAGSPRQNLAAPLNLGSGLQAKSSRDNAGSRRGGPSGTHGGVGGGALSSTERVGVTAFGSQGEGAIVGSYLDYEAQLLSDHSSFMHSLIEC